MEAYARISLSQRLLNEKQLLREEKYIVNALKRVKEERFALQSEEKDLVCQLKELLKQGKSSTNNDQGQLEKFEKMENSKVENSPVADAQNNSFLSEFQVTGVDLDGVVANQVELNLTVPTHHLYEQMPEEAFEEIDTEDDFEVEMSMLMHSGDKPNH